MQKTQFPAQALLNKGGEHFIQATTFNARWYAPHSDIVASDKFFRKAISCYSLAIDLEPKNSIAYYVRGLAREKTLDLFGAKEDFQKAKGINPKFDDARKALDAINLRIISQEDVISDCGKKIQANPSDAYPYNSRGNAKLELGLIREASEDFQKAIDCEKDFNWAVRNKEYASYLQSVAPLVEKVLA